MKLLEYFNQLKDFIELHPECLDMDVIYSTDDEGNSYQKVHYGPSVGILEDTDFSFRTNDNTLTAILLYCRIIGPGDFLNATGTGKTRYCIDGNNEPNNQG